MMDPNKMPFYGSQDKANLSPEYSAKVETPFFGATCRIEVSGMKAQIIQHISAAMAQDLEPAINSAVEKAISEKYWKEHLEDQVFISLNKMIDDAVDRAIRYNTELSDIITKYVRGVVSENLVKIVKGE